MEKQVGVEDLFKQEVRSAKKANPTGSDPLKTAGGIPETRTNEDGHLEIFEAYDSEPEEPPRP